jgi:hypothetical protein
MHETVYRDAEYALLEAVVLILIPLPLLVLALRLPQTHFYSPRPAPGFYDYINPASCLVD